MESKYFLYSLASNYGQTQFQMLKTGSTLQQLPVGRLFLLRIPVAPRDEQKQIVAEVERRLSVADAVEITVDASLKQAERLRQSILKRAFAGKLVLQDPSDEPAERLLERIREHTQALS